jgi:hypothetical protein
MAPGPQELFDALFDAQDASAQVDDRRLLDASLQPEGRLGPVVGHGSGNQVEQLALDYAGETVRAYFKPANGLSKRTLDIYRQTRASSTLAEAAAWRLAAELGPPYSDLVAPCVLRFIDDIDDQAPGALSLHRPGETESEEPLRLMTDICCDAAFFDALIAQQDRHSGNWLWDVGSQRLTLFDHGCSFARSGHPCSRSKLSMARRAAQRGRLTDEEIAILERLRDDAGSLGLAAFLEDERAESLRLRAEAMLGTRMVLSRGDFR